MPDMMEYQTDLVETSIKMVSTWFVNRWKQDFPGRENLPTPKLVRSTDDLRTYKEDQGSTTYPFIMMLLTSIGVDPDRAGLSKRFLPLVTGRSENSERAQVSNAIPVKIGLGLTLRTDNLEDLICMSHMLIFNAPKVTLRLSNEFGFVFEIGLNIEPDLSIPGADMGFPSKEYRFETSMFIQSFITRAREQGVIRNIVFEVIDSGGLANYGTFPDLGVLTKHTIKHTDLLNKTSPYYKEN